MPNIYTFVDYTGYLKEIVESDLNYTGAWRSSANYYRYDVVTYSYATYVCTVANTNAEPPTLYQFDNSWSILSFTSTGTSSTGTISQSDTSALYSLAYHAYLIAIAGTNSASAAYNVARLALDTAWVGTNTGGGSADTYSLARLALNTAWAGTSAASAAYSVARTALDTSWTGTFNAAQAYALGWSALDTAWDGTAAAQAAYSVGRTALDTAWVGTSAASAAYSLALNALHTAWVGTNTPSPSGGGSGTVPTWVMDWLGQTYNIATTGTNAANQAYSLARTALDTAWAGTVIPPLSTLPDVSIASPSAGNILAFDGAKWISAYPSTETSHAAVTYYLDGTSLSDPGYECLTLVPIGGVEVEETAVGCNTSSGIKLIDQYVSGTLGRTSLGAGIWEYNTYASATAAKCYVNIKTYVKSGTFENFLWETSSPELLSTPGLVASEVFGTNVITNASDRLVIRYYGRHDGGSAEDISLYHNGLSNYTHIHTPLTILHNDLGGLQGGQSNEYYHVSANESAALTGDSAPSASNVFITNNSFQVVSSTATRALNLAVVGTNSASAAYSVGRTALDTAWTGTTDAQSAYSVARIALDTAWVGTTAAQSAYSIGRTALDTAWVGTSAAQAAYAVARTALDTAWIGTNAGQAAYNIGRIALDTSWAGTNIGQAAYSIGRTALDTAWIGTSAASAAYSLALTALQTAWTGTNLPTPSGGGSGTVPAWVMDWLGQTYNMAVAGTNSANAAYSLARTALDTAWAGTVIPPLSTLPDVSIAAPTAGQVLTYNGATWVAGDSSATSSAGIFTLYLDDTPSGTTGTTAYNTLLTIPVGTPEVPDSVALNNSTSLIEGYLSSNLNRTQLDAGIWEFNSYAFISAAGRTCQLFADVYKRNIAGTETYLFSGTQNVTATTATLVSTVVVAPAYVCSTTDKLVVKYFGRRTGTAVTLTLLHNGSTNYTHLHTPIALAHNDLSGLQGGQTGEFYHLTASQRDAANNAYLPSADNPFATTSVTNAIDTTARIAWGLAQTGTTAAAAAQASANTALSLISGLTPGGSDSAYSGTLTAYVSQVSGWKSDLELTIVNGDVSRIGQSKYSIEVFTNYSPGPVGTIAGDLGGGSSWNGTGRAVGWSQNPNDYNRESNVGLSGGAWCIMDSSGTYGQPNFYLSNGTGWGASDPWIIVSEGYKLAGTENFDSFSAGVVLGTDFSSATGYGWAGTVGFY